MNSPCRRTPSNRDPYHCPSLIDNTLTALNVHTMMKKSCQFGSLLSITSFDNPKRSKVILSILVKVRLGQYTPLSTHLQSTRLSMLKEAPHSWLRIMYGKSLLTPQDVPTNTNNTIGTKLFIFPVKHWGIHQYKWPWLALNDKINVDWLIFDVEGVINWRSLLRGYLDGLR